MSNSNIPPAEPGVYLNEIKGKEEPLSLLENS
jgi:hypothetical protein